MSPSLRARDLRLGDSLTLEFATSPSETIIDWAGALSGAIGRAFAGDIEPRTVSLNLMSHNMVPSGAHCVVVGRRYYPSQHRADIDLFLEVAGSTGPVATGQCTMGVPLNAADVAELTQAERASFNSEEWATALVDDLADDEQFRDATSAFDGSIAFSFGATSVAVRIYRGRKIDRGRHLVGGATFGVGASPMTWVDFARRPRNEFISFAMSDRFEIRGSTYDYLRMTRALVVATDVVRRLLSAEMVSHA